MFLSPLPLPQQPTLHLNLPLLRQNRQVTLAGDKFHLLAAFCHLTGHFPAFVWSCLQPNLPLIVIVFLINLTVSSEQQKIPKIEHVALFCLLIKTIHQGC